MDAYLSIVKKLRFLSFSALVPLLCLAVVCAMPPVEEDDLWGRNASSQGSEEDDEYSCPQRKRLMMKRDLEKAASRWSKSAVNEGYEDIMKCLGFPLENVGVEPEKNEKHESKLVLQKKGLKRDIF